MRMRSSRKMLRKFFYSFISIIIFYFIIFFFLFYFCLDAEKPMKLKKLAGRISHSYNVVYLSFFPDILTN